MGARRFLHPYILGFVMVIQTLFPPSADSSNLFYLRKVSEGVFVAIARQGNKPQSNTLILIGKSRVMLAGAHFTAEIINDLTKEVSTLTPFPIRSVILTHHHKGFPFVDFDFPRSFDLFLTWQTRQNMKEERRTIPNNLYSFDSTMTIDFDGTIIELTNVGTAHSNGDMILYLPESGILFTSDLLFNDVIGFMGDGSYRNWLELLDRMEQIGATTIIPGLGEPSNTASISRFRSFFRDFLTEVIRLKSLGKTLKDARTEFTLPSEYQNLPGYKTFMTSNIEKAYTDPDIQ